jgi:SAM-dependent methyltransferase
MLRFEADNLAKLTLEQAGTQANKCQTRLLRQYHDDYLFMRDDKGRQGSAVGEFLQARSLEGRDDIYHLLLGLGAQATEMPIRWVDMGGGRMFAQRDLRYRYGQGIDLSAVDLFDYGLDGLDEQQARQYEHLFTEPAPRLIQDDATSVQLADTPHLITSIELIEYLDDPLRAIANFYNQAAPGGVVIVGAGYDWSRSILRRDPVGNVIRNPDHMPAAELLRSLRTHNIAFAASRGADGPLGQRAPLRDEAYQVLAIEKRAHTRLEIGRAALPPCLMPDGYKVQYYPTDTPDGSPLLSIVET